MSGRSGRPEKAGTFDKGSGLKGVDQDWGSMFSNVKRRRGDIPLLYIGSALAFDSPARQRRKGVRLKRAGEEKKSKVEEKKTRRLGEKRSMLGYHQGGGR